MSQDKIELNMNLPLDADGFLRRECPSCEKQFKWYPTQSAADKQATSELPNYYCPLCGEIAQANAWWTPAQIEHATALARAEVVGPMLNKFQSDLRRLNRPGGNFRVTANPVNLSSPAPLAPEPNDMRVVIPMCHPNEPIKVPTDRSEPVHCLMCGQLTSTKGENL